MCGHVLSEGARLGVLRRLPANELLLRRIKELETTNDTIQERRRQSAEALLADLNKKNNC